VKPAIRASPIAPLVAPRDILAADNTGNDDAGGDAADRPATAVSPPVPFIAASPAAVPSPASDE
jgi:hypothetical protein